MNDYKELFALPGVVFALGAVVALVCAGIYNQVWLILAALGAGLLAWLFLWLAWD